MIRAAAVGIDIAAIGRVAILFVVHACSYVSQQI